MPTPTATEGSANKASSVDGVGGCVCASTVSTVCSFVSVHGIINVTIVICVQILVIDKIFTKALAFPDKLINYLGAMT